jgi:alkaline phosphatase D
MEALHTDPKRGAAATAALVGAVVITLVSCRGAGEPAERTLVAHDFAASAEGWLVAGDTGDAAPVFQPSGGHPGGYISSDDEAVGETWYFRAPGSVLAQLPAAEYGILKYSLRQSSADAGFVEDDVIITGPAGRLSYRFGRAPGTAWTDFSVRLSASAGWQWNWSARATQEQIRSVLRDPKRLQIRGEYRTGPDVGGLDTFSLTAGASRAGGAARVHLRAPPPDVRDMTAPQIVAGAVPSRIRDRASRRLQFAGRRGAEPLFSQMSSRGAFHVYGLFTTSRSPSPSTSPRRPSCQPWPSTRTVVRKRPVPSPYSSHAVAAG